MRNCTKVTFDERDGIPRRCRKRALVFGRFAGGGFCIEHARQFADEFGDAEFHPEGRALLEPSATDSRE